MRYLPSAHPGLHSVTSVSPPISVCENPVALKANQVCGEETARTSIKRSRSHAAANRPFQLILQTLSELSVLPGTSYRDRYGSMVSCLSTLGLCSLMSESHSYRSVAVLSRSDGPVHVATVSETHNADRETSEISVTSGEAMIATGLYKFKGVASETSFVSVRAYS